MGFDDFFENENRHSRHGRDHDYDYNDHNQRSHSYNQHTDIKQQFLNKLKNNPQLKTLIIVAGVVILIIVVIVAILLIPLIMKLFHYLSENGIQGIVNTIWKGTK
jgi:hypothetical protein